MKPGTEEFLAEKRIAVVGVSRTRGFGNTVFRALVERGYEVYPVNSLTDTVDGQRCYNNLSELPAEVGAVLTVVRPDQTLKIVEDCLRRGIKRIWMQQGSESDEAIRLAETGDISVVHHACILMYAQPTSIHRLHRWINRKLGKL